MTASVDILMITHTRAQYTALSLPRLLDSCDESMRVWVWHNGDDEQTLSVVRAHREHPRFHRFYHSHDNALIRKPTNWLFGNASGDLLSVVADDCLVEPAWMDRLRAAHAKNSALGVLACWPFMEDDFDRERSANKVRELDGGDQLLVNPWVQGSGVVLKRQCVEDLGLLPPRDKGFTSYCLRLAAAGWVNGWLVPLVLIEHMDHPLSPNTRLRNDADLCEFAPLSVRMRGCTTISQWLAHQRLSARIVQEAPLDPRLYFGWRKKWRRMRERLQGQKTYY